MLFDEKLYEQGWKSLWEEDQEDREAEEKRDRLSNSCLYDIHKWSDHPEVNSFVDFIFGKHFAEKKIEIAKRHIKSALLHFYVTWKADPERVTAFSFNNNDYKANSRYNELHISRKIISVMTTLIDAGLLEIEGGFYDRGTKRGKLSRLWPSQELVSLFRQARFSVYDISSSKDRIAVILRDGDPDTDRPRDMEYEPNRQTEAMEEFLRKYNALLHRTFIDIPNLDDPTFDVGEGREARRLTVNQNNKFVRRVFNRGSFECNGRFWGGWWQSCPKEWRRSIFIEDWPTIEIDFSGLHIVMLYAMEGLDYWSLKEKDPYLIGQLPFFRTDEHGREIAKKLMLVMLNARDKASAFRAFRANAPSKSVEKSLTDKQLSEVYDGLSELHPEIAHYFASDVGIRLMNLDSEITAYILERFTDKGIPVLSVHDSYIVPEGCADMLIEMMYEGFELVMGIAMTRMDGRSLKEAGERVEYLEGMLNTYGHNYADEVWLKEISEAYFERTSPNKTERYKRELVEFREWKKTVIN